VDLRVIGSKHVDWIQLAKHKRRKYVDQLSDSAPCNQSDDV
jgi:hypothetical protein